jgi:hypothetical protein
LGQISQQEEELFMQAWKADPDIIKNHNYEDKSKIYLSLAIIHMLELSTNPTIFEKFFRARNPEFYNSVFEKFYVLLRTAPLDRLNSYLNSLICVF